MNIPVNYDLTQLFRQRPILDNTIWLLGCSNIWGVGVELEDTVGVQLEKLTGKTVANLGVCGGSPELVYDILQRLLQSHVPERVIVSWPNLGRIFYILQDSHTIMNIGPWISEPGYDVSKFSKQDLDRYKQGIADGSIVTKNAVCIEKTKRLIICPYLSFSIHHDIKEIVKNKHRFIDHGSDGLHPGPKTNRLIAEYMAEWINIHQH